MAIRPLPVSKRKAKQIPDYSSIAAGAGLGGRPGGDYVVDHNDALAAKRASCRRHPECSGDVLPPLRRSEPDLGVLRLTLASRKQSTGMPVRPPTAWPNMADWLKRRDQSRDR